MNYTDRDLTCPARLIPLRWGIKDVIDGDGRARVVGGDFTMTARFQVVRVHRGQLKSMLNARLVQAAKR